MIRVFICFILLSFVSSRTYCQKRSGQTDSIYTVVDLMPEFVGGPPALLQYLQQNVIYPKKEKEAGITGRVFLEFVVRKDGSISNVSEKQGIKNAPGLSKEAVRLVKKMPVWQPGIQQGVPVDVSIVMPIHFSLAGQSYTSIDEKAARIPDSITVSTKKIAEYINANFTGDNDRTRAIFVWITANVQYDIDNMFAINFNEKEEEKITKVIKNRKGICSHYALLFNQICKEAGIPSYVVIGYTRQDGFTDYIPHAWCAAQVEKSWYIFDPTWGSGYVNNGKFIKKTRNDYFKIPPAKMIASHQPFDYLWQFLNYPVTASDFYAGKTQQDRTKPYFNYADSIEAYNKATRLKQLASMIRRIESNGVKNSMIFDRLANAKLEVLNLERKQISDTYNAAVADHNDAIKYMNLFIEYRNKQFQPTKNDTAIQNMVTISENKLSDSKRKLSSIKSDDEGLNTMILSLNNSVDEVQKSLQEHKQFLAEYLSKNKTQRKLMFYNKH